MVMIIIYLELIDELWNSAGKWGFYLYRCRQKQVYVYSITVQPKIDETTPLRSISLIDFKLHLPSLLHPQLIWNSSR